MKGSLRVRQVLLVVAVSVIWTLPALTGCGGESRETGTTVEMTPEDIAGFEAAEASYEAMETGGR